MTDSSLRLRPATASDAVAVAALLTELGHPTLASVIPTRISALTREGGAAIVAVDARDHPLGLLCLARHATLHTTGPIAFITTLVARAFEWAREHRCTRLSVTSAERRADAHALYPACGLPYTGRRFAAALDVDPQTKP
ncbi:MAG: GNAT family N-acetyltransferase [Gemmatimonadaceae bacterium]|nr:GNAT family N-acetyltransferase [Gemmatimonadaceae bacterium]